jgi:hypothetical protein
MEQIILKMYTWVNGALNLSKRKFHRVEEAIKHAQEQGAHSFKVWDHNGDLVHSQNHPTQSVPNYA